MIKIEKIDYWGFEHALRGMRNPLNSWTKGDSMFENNNHDIYYVGDNDLDLANRLYKAGPEHRKYLRQIFISLDITAPLYWWKEMDQYRIGVTTNSCSTMHKLLAKPFEMEDFSFDKLPGYKTEIKQFTPEISEEMIAIEKWVNYDDEYEVSNYGRIKHNLKNHYRILGGSKHKDGYIFVTIHEKQIPLHRIVGMCFLKDSYKDGFVINHKDGNKQNNFVDNLEWVSQKDNIEHSYKNNLQPKAVSTYTGKFTPEERENIKALWNEGIFSKREIAKKYGVSHTCINDIINDKYKYASSVNLYEQVARPLVDTLNELRDAWFIEEDNDKKKEIWYSIVQLLPTSYNQKRTITMNYENIITIIKQRSGHKLDEWNTLVDIFKDLPYIHSIMEV